MVAGGLAVMTIMGHPDDAELWAGGVLDKHVRAGATATIVVARHSRERDDAAAASASSLGASLSQPDLLTVESVEELLIESRPDVVITHPFDDVHEAHRDAAEAVLAAIPRASIATGHPSRLYTCDSYNNLNWHGRPLDQPIIVDVTDSWSAKIAALALHTSEPVAEHFGPMAEMLGRLHGSRIGVQFAEAFRPVPVLGRLPSTSYL